MQDRPVVVDIADTDGGAISAPRSVVVFEEFGLDARALVDHRYAKFRKMGNFFA